MTVTTEVLACELRHGAENVLVVDGRQTGEHLKDAPRRVRQLLTAATLARSPVTKGLAVVGRTVTTTTAVPTGGAVGVVRRDRLV